LQEFRGEFGTHRKRLLSAAGFAAIAAPILFSAIIAVPGWAEFQNTTTAAPEYKYEVASIRTSKSDSGRWTAPPDAFTGTGVTPLKLIQVAYKITAGYGLSGGPSWLTSEHYDIDAKMDAGVADAIAKLGKDERAVARQQMLQALLADRFGLGVHWEARELPVYILAIAKNGPKLQDAKPGDTYPNGVKLSTGPMGVGMTLGISGGDYYIAVQGVPVAAMIPTLSGFVGRPVLDKTGLASNYDFKLQWTRVDSQLQAPATGSSNDQPPPAPTDSSSPNLFTAIQQQLGLKLESGKGSVEVIVIDHIERPSGN
jgi:uncharacterized protein (TIGR03435 family)